MSQLMTDLKLRTNYFSKIDHELQKLKNKGTEEFQTIVDACITKTFEDSYLNRLQTMYDKSREA